MSLMLSHQAVPRIRCFQTTATEKALAQLDERGPGETQPLKKILSAVWWSPTSHLYFCFYLFYFLFFFFSCMHRVIR